MPGRRLSGTRAFDRHRGPDPGDDYEVLDRHSPLIEIQPGHRYPLGDTWCAAVVTSRQTLTHAGTDAIEPMRSHPAYGGLQLEAYIGTPIVVDAPSSAP
ncbi:hypothetical protein [Metallibacterium scheffleri]|uniref:hypothetical protein n=1 Tax=Metallibacterium scheffleri TaxID=993689 RepID=UPI001592B053|nr:hypothetical protein [Metallibacterium scheffleri]